MTKLCDPNESEGPETARPRLSRIASRYLKREVADNDFKSVSSGSEDRVLNIEVSDRKNLYRFISTNIFGHPMQRADSLERP